MPRLSLLSVLAAVILLSAAHCGAAQDRIAWNADLRGAQQTAARDGKLVLLHFYSDNCPPCKTLERNVFSRGEVAAAMATNYVPVKVHVDSMPQLAQRYQIEAWPTDVIVTSAGLEVFRTISPQSPAQYQTMLDQVAFQTGVGAGRLAGGNLLDSSARQGRRGDVSLTGATAPAEQTAAASALPPTTPPAPRQEQQAARPPSRSPQSGAMTADGTPYVGGAYYSPPADRWAGTAGQRAPTTAPQSIYADPAQPSAQANPPAAPPPAPQPQRQQVVVNPAVSSQPVRSIYDPSPAPSAQAQNVHQPAASPQQPAAQPMRQPPAGQAPAGQQASAQFRRPQFVKVSEAPPFAIEQFCPVTLLESKKWHKGNVRFGAVHRNRTYLFASEDAQRRFLADPERYAPAFSGCDPVLFAETNQWIDGNPSIGLLIGGKTFFFVSAESRSRFELSPQAYAARAYQAMSAARPE